MSIFQTVDFESLNNGQLATLGAMLGELVDGFREAIALAEAGDSDAFGVWDDTLDSVEVEYLTETLGEIGSVGEDVLDEIIEHAIMQQASKSFAQQVIDWLF